MVNEMKSPDSVIRSLIRTVPDFPKPGILFYDISTVLKEKEGLRACTEALSSVVTKLTFDKIAAIDSRGFIFGAALAQSLEKGLILIRKKGKLPGKTVSKSYGLEYGQDTIEICDNAVAKGERVILVDDLLATGGTARASCDLIESLGGKIVSVAFLIELTTLNGRKFLNDYQVESILKV